MRSHSMITVISEDFAIPEVTESAGAAEAGTGRAKSLQLNSTRIWLSEREYRKDPTDFFKKANRLCGDGMGSRHQYHAYTLQWERLASGRFGAGI